LRRGAAWLGPVVLFAVVISLGEARPRHRDGRQSFNFTKHSAGGRFMGDRNWVSVTFPRTFFFFR